MINKQTNMTIQKVLLFFVIVLNPFWVLVRLQNSVWDFFGFCFKPKGFFRILIYVPICTSWSLEIQSTLPEIIP